MLARFKSVFNIFTFFALLTFLIGSTIFTTPAYAASIVVNSSADNTTDDGYCTLREAIIAANTNAAYRGCQAGSNSTDYISFAADYIITLGSALPIINSSIDILGNSAQKTIIQANATPNTAGYRVFDINGGTVGLYNMTVRHGGNGGIKATNNSILTIHRSSIENNSSPYDGGGITSFGGSLTIYYSAILNNTAEWGDGGGILTTGNVEISDSTFSNNTAIAGAGFGGYGSVIWSHSSSGTKNITITNSTFSGNNGRNYALGFVNNIVTIRNSIIANNTGTTQCYSNSVSTTNIGSSNLSNSPNCFDATVSPSINLAPLAYNGGRTQTFTGTQTFAITSSSSAYDAGDNDYCSLQDQRGFSHPQGTTCDIGAYEVDQAPLVTQVYSSIENGTYKTGDVIPVSVVFNEDLTKTGTPQLTLETGTTDRTVIFSRISGPRQLIFDYTVQAGDTSSDLDYVATTSLSLNGGTLKDSTNNNAALTLPAPGAVNSLGANNAFVIDTTTPTANSFTRQTPLTETTDADSLTFRVTFSEGVVNVDAADFAIMGTTATVSNVSPNSSTEYDITVSGGDLASFNGTVGLNFAASPDIADTAGNALAGDEPNIDETYTIDNTAPEMDLSGNSISIVNGANSPDATDDTDFGNADTVSGTISHTFTIENTGDALLTLSEDPLVDISGTNADSFSITALPAASIEPGNTTTFTVKFKPGALGAHTATISIANNDNDENPYTFDILGTGTVAPTNDDFDHAKDISTLSYADEISSLGATIAEDDPNVTECGLGTGSATVWYKYTPPSNSAISINTLSANYDTFIAVWTGSRGEGNLIPVTCNNDFNGTPQSSVAFQVQGGTTYYIEIGQP